MDVTFEGARIERGGRTVLDIPALHLAAKRTTAILGPNGSGKTTLLRAIAGLERLSAGRVLAGGSPAPSRPWVAFVFQEQVFLRQSVRENLELGLRLQRVVKPDRAARIEEAAALLGIAHLMDRRADHLSGGEKRRVGLARAMCLRAPLVLLDEPLEGLDGRTYARLLEELPQLLRAFEATTLLVTHSRDEALRVAQDLVVIVDGRVHAAGDKREMTSNPRCASVAEVLGYLVLPVGGRQVGVPRSGLTPGPGPLEFVMVVEDVLDLVERREVVGRIGDVRVHVVLPASCEAPACGATIRVHADRFCELA